MQNNSFNVFIVLKPSARRSMIHESDREFFSAPVQVFPSHCNLDTKQLYVRSPLQNGAVYPCDRSALKSEYQLTNKQRAAARRCS